MCVSLCSLHDQSLSGFCGSSDLKERYGLRDGQFTTTDVTYEFFERFVACGSPRPSKPIWQLTNILSNRVLIRFLTSLLLISLS